MKRTPLFALEDRGERGKGKAFSGDVVARETRLAEKAKQKLLRISAVQAAGVIVGIYVRFDGVREAIRPRRVLSSDQNLPAPALQNVS
jgi:hypothetical protein